MPVRPIAQQVWSGSTSTGSGQAEFGTGHRYVSAYIGNASTKAFVNAVEVSVGNSTVWATASAASTSTGDVIRTSTGGLVFDKARVNVSANATTGIVNVWLIAAD